MHGFVNLLLNVITSPGGEVGSVAIRIAGTGAQRPVENRINPIRDDAAGAQYPVPTGFIPAIIFIRRQRRASSADGKGRRENNLGQHFVSPARLID
jgi:hypothetical protein